MREKSQGLELNAMCHKDHGILRLIKTYLVHSHSEIKGCSPKTPEWRKQPGSQHTALSHWSLLNRDHDAALVNARPKEFCCVLLTRKKKKVNEKKSKVKENEAEEEMNSEQLGSLSTKIIMLPSCFVFLQNRIQKS